MSEARLRVARAVVWQHLETHRRHLIVALGIALVLMLAFVASYVTALSNPRPHRIPVAVVGTSAADQQLVSKLQQRVGSALDVRRTGSFDDARRLISDQDIFAAIVPGRGGVQLYTASAAGATTARVFTQAAPQVARSTGTSIEVSDLDPLPAKDPNGLVAFYVILGCVIYGYVGALLSAQAAPAVPPRARLVALAAFAAFSGLLIALLVRVVLDVLPSPFLSTAGIAALAIFTASTVTALLVHIARPVAMPLAIIVLVILGSPASGGAVSTDLLPAFHRFVGQWLPPGAGVSAMRDVAYFPGHEHARPLLVLGAWVLVALVALLVIEARQPAKAARRGTPPLSPLSET